jgi:4'-phosphopantetheinyl transferase
MEGRSLTLYCGETEVANWPSGTAGHMGTDHVHLWFTELSAQPEQVDRLHGLLDADELERAARFRFDHDRQRFIIGHGLLRHVLSELLNMSPGAIRFARGPHGKPYVQDAGLHFNFSDTKDAILIAVSEGAELGVDVETMARTVDHMAVGEHYFTPEEVADIRDTPDPKRRFLELWTRKEAVLKASGVGIMDDLKVLRVNTPQQTVELAHEEFRRMAAAQYHVRTWHLGPDHIISLATSAAPAGVTFLPINF